MAAAIHSHQDARRAHDGSESTPEDQSIPTTAKRSWKRVATSAGYAIVFVAALSALLSPNYWSQALSAAAGGMLILAARTLP